MKRTTSKSNCGSSGSNDGDGFAERLRRDEQYI